MRELADSPARRHHPGAQFRKLLDKGELLVLPGTFSPLGARIIERVGFSAAYISGYAVSAHWLGLPDVGFITMSEMLDTARRIVQAVRIPILVDIDTGYGNALNVIRAVREFLDAGVAALQLEDQVSPKRCGHVAGRQVIAIEEAVGKIRAAHAARNDSQPDGVIVARTDARGAVGGSLEEAIERGQAYAEAGADVIFVEGLLSEEEIEACAKSIPAPLLYNMAGVSPRVDFKRLSDLGVRVVIVPGLHNRAAAVAMWDAAAGLMQNGVAGVAVQDPPAGHPLEEFHSFVGFDYIRHLENEFLPPEEVLKKYESPSIGYMPADKKPV